MSAPVPVATPAIGQLRSLWLAWIVVGGICLVPLLLPDRALSSLFAWLPLLSHHVLPEKALYSPFAYWLLFTLVWWVQSRWPAAASPFFSRALRQDLFWYLASMGLRLLFLGVWAQALVAFYSAHLGFLTLPGVAHWHPLAQFALGVLLADFARWLSHLIRHKVPLFWAFHAVHHSQRNLNLFTDARVHPLDRMVSSLITSLVLVLTGNNAPAIILWMVFETVYPKFYHANTRLDFGPLRFLLVTPQSHRVHHGIERRYHDCNFGFIFSFWDRLFGTQFRDHRVYPATGIPDTRFPLEDREGHSGPLKTLCSQLIYPFFLWRRLP
ncbi:MAG: hypothetical protein CME40_02125 [Haliea sp.]|nr:hypothetical protein [Haliea sp.]|tara:strand:+ start:79415 stop:80389 length:975 start_codon:yes stop_codon:yes gene_type:complete